MKLLLDTHYVYALAVELDGLSGREKRYLAADERTFVVSAVSIWEISLKWNKRHASGERKGPRNPAEVLTVIGGEPRVVLLPLTPAHAGAALDPPLDHTDPFDQLLLVQAQEEGIKLLTRDRALRTHAHAQAIP